MSPKNARGRTRVIGPGRRHPVPITLDAAAWRGGQVIGTDDRIYFSDGARWKGIPFTEEAVTLARQDIEVTVGAGGDYTSLADALDYFNSLVPSNAASQLQGTVRILSGTVIAEQIIVRQANLGWVQIKADDATVTVVESALVSRATTGAEFPFMEFIGNAPVISCFFESDQSRIDTRTTAGVIVRAGYLATRPDIEGDDLAILPQCGFGRFSINVAIRSGAALRFTDSAKVIDARTSNITVGAGSTASFAGGVFTGAGSSSIVASGGQITISGAQPGVLNAPTANWRRNGTSDQATDIVLTRNAYALIGATGGTVLGGTSQAPWVYLPSGYVHDVRQSQVQIIQGIARPTSYTVATQPSAAAYPAHMIHVSNGDSGAPCLAVSDGTNWLRIPLGAAVST